MKRRWFIPAAVLAAMALALGACGGDDEGGTEAGDGSITVFSLWGGSEQEAFQKVLDQFTEDTGIETKYESARDFLPVIRTRLAAGNPAGRRGHPAARRRGRARARRRPDPARGHGPRPGRSTRTTATRGRASPPSTTRCTASSRRRTRRARSGTSRTPSRRRLRDPATWETSSRSPRSTRARARPVGGRRPGTRQLVDPDRLVREHLRPPGRLRQLHEAVQR